MKLPDVNVWLAGVWARHALHAIARAWLTNERDEIAFCRVTQMALLRLVSNPAVTGDDSLTRRQAWELIDRLMADRRIPFLAEPERLVPLWVAFSKRDDRSHLLWTDDYLAAFASAAGAELVTLDRAFPKRYPSVQVRCLV
ncbi:MAG: TA system VapC family ribonuclease toxin [Acidobacteriota bacterium]